MTKFRNWLKARGTLQAREPNSVLAGLLRTPRPRERADFRTPRSNILTNPSENCPDYLGSRFPWKREAVLCACAVALHSGKCSLQFATTRRKEWTQDGARASRLVLMSRSLCRHSCCGLRRGRPGLKGHTLGCPVSEAFTVQSRGGSASYEERLILLYF